MQHSHEITNLYEKKNKIRPEIDPCGILVIYHENYQHIPNSTQLLKLFLC